MSICFQFSEGKYNFHKWIFSFLPHTYTWLGCNINIFYGILGSLFIIFILIRTVVNNLLYMILYVKSPMHRSPVSVSFTFSNLMTFCWTMFYSGCWIIWCKLVSYCMCITYISRYCLYWTETYIFKKKNFVKQVI